MQHLVEVRAFSGSTEEEEEEEDDDDNDGDWVGRWRLELDKKSCLKKCTSCLVRHKRILTYLPTILLYVCAVQCK